MYSGGSPIACRCPAILSVEMEREFVSVAAGATVDGSVGQLGRGAGSFTKACRKAGTAPEPSEPLVLAPGHVDGPALRAGPTGVGDSAARPIRSTAAASISQISSSLNPSSTRRRTRFTISCRYSLRSAMVRPSTRLRSRAIGQVCSWVYVQVHICIRLPRPNWEATRLAVSSAPVPGNETLDAMGNLRFRW